MNKKRISIILFVSLLVITNYVCGKNVKVSVFSYPNLNNNGYGSDDCSTETDNLINIIKSWGGYDIDNSIVSFSNATLLESQLDACKFFFIPDLENISSVDDSFLPVASAAVIADWVSTGRVMVMTGTSGSVDADFLNKIFSWDLGNIYGYDGDTWDKNDANAAGTPFEDVDVEKLTYLDATDGIVRNNVENFKAVWGTDDNAAVAVIKYGSGYVIYLGYDFYGSGPGCSQNNSAWVQDFFPVAMEYATSLSSIDNISYTTAEYTYSFSEDGTAYYLIVPGGAAAPTAAQIEAGESYSGVTIVVNENASISASTDHVFSLSGLTAGTGYDIYAVTIYNDNGKESYSEIKKNSFKTLVYTVPELTTTSVSSIEAVSAESGGEITDYGGQAITKKGVCWNTTGSPTLSDDYTEDGSGSAAFTSSLTGLSEKTTYYVRAYATNSIGTSYGEEESFTTPCAVPPAHLFRSGSLVDDYCSIQEAIDASQDGDSIYIDAGTFTEQLTISTGIVLQGADKEQTIIESPDAEELSISGGSWKSLKNKDIFAIIGIKTNNDSQVKIKGLTIDGMNQGYLPDTDYPIKDDYAFQGIGAINSNLLVDNVKITRVRTVGTEHGGVLPVGYEPTDQPSGINHNELIFAESAAGAGEHILEVSNTYIDKFQKTAILAWGPTLTVNIHDNTIQGYGQTLWSTGNGIQVGSSDYSSSGGGDRRGTKGSITNNQILDIGLVIPETEDLADHIGKDSPSCILLWEAGEGFIISGNTISRTIQTKSRHVDFTSADGGYGSEGIAIVASKRTIVKDNTIEGYDEAIAPEDYAGTTPNLIASNNTVTNNTIDYLLSSGPSKVELSNSHEVLTYFSNSPGNDTISNFAFGDTIQIVNLTTGVVNGKLINGDPSIDYSNGTITAYDGSDVAALSMQVKSGDTTSLYIDTDEIAGADLMLVLKGKYLPSNFYFNKDYIIYQYMLPQVTTASVTDYGATMATLGGKVSYDGGTTVTERGVVYSATNTTPELGGTDVVKDTNGNGEGTFSESISSLKPGTTYYYQAYAINSVGTSYGGVESIETYDLTAECKDITVYLDQLGAVTIDSSYVNNGSVAEAGIKTIKLSDYNFSCSDIGNNNVTMTVKDQLGSTVQCVSDVTVSDKMAPVFELIRDVEVQLSAGECETTIDYPEINVRDNCSSIELEQLQGLGSDGTFPVGVTTEIWRGTDRYGNNDIISFDVIVTAGNSVPTIDAVSDLLVDEYTSSVVVPLTGISGGEDCTMQDVEVNASADNSELISSVSVNYEDGTTGSIELFFTSPTDGVSEVTVTVKDSEGAVTTERFQVTVDGSNHAPFVVDTIPNQVVNASYELKVSLSSKLGVLFDDIDDSSLELEVVEEGADILPSWAVYENDTLYCTPMIEDMGCSNIVVTAIDGEGATVSDTFQICVEGYPLAIGDLDDGGLLNVELYPNPTQGEAVVHINSSEIEDIEIAVMDISGRMVMRKQYSGEQTIRIDMSGKVSGMYFIRLTLDGKQVIKKLILDKK